jgi:hypothetical protein
MFDETFSYTEDGDFTVEHIDRHDVIYNNDLPSFPPSVICPDVAGRYQPTYRGYILHCPCCDATL